MRLLSIFKLLVFCFQRKTPTNKGEEKNSVQKNRSNNEEQP